MMRVLPMPIANYRIDGKDLFTESQMQAYTIQCQEAAKAVSLREWTGEEFIAEARRRGYFPKPEPKLWLWKNFVDGKPEYWAFDNPYPTNLDNGDPQTLGQPCGYAIFKPSRDGSDGRTEEEVLRQMKSVTAPPQREWVGLTDEEGDAILNSMPFGHNYKQFYEAIEAKLREKNGNF